MLSGSRLLRQGRLEHYYDVREVKLTRMPTLLMNFIDKDFVSESVTSVVAVVSGGLSDSTFIEGFDRIFFNGL